MHTLAGLSILSCICTHTSAHIIISRYYTDTCMCLYIRTFIGIWIRDLRRSSNLQQPQIAKILKTLMSRKLIKCERSIAGKNKKVYMLYDLEPAKEVTGMHSYLHIGLYVDKDTCVGVLLCISVLVLK